MSQLRQMIEGLAQKARQAARTLSLSTAVKRTEAIRCIAQALRKNAAVILEANELDLKEAQAANLSLAMLDRLRLDPGRLEAIACAAEAVAAQPDPLGEVLESWTRPNGLKITKLRIPIGLIAIVFESRPNVTVDAAVLCLRSGNACILRGGHEALRTNQALANAIHEGLKAADLPTEIVTLVPVADREAVIILGSLRGVVDLIIPRGGPGLIEAVTSTAQVPVVKHDAGICHIYVHAAAELPMAETILLNAKCQKPGVCNAAETLLVDASIAASFLPQLDAALRSRQTSIRACPLAQPYMPSSQAASPSDWSTEHLSLILNVRVVSGLNEALSHIAQYGSGHSDAIVTADAVIAQRFLSEVDSACVYHNASTRFTDGGEFGFGAEVGISTGRLHARGPMGARELTTWKFTIEGNGQARD
jgi:glutamate-5-semialdehyde dehydrogenase